MSDSPTCPKCGHVLIVCQSDVAYKNLCLYCYQYEETIKDQKSAYIEFWPDRDDADYRYADNGALLPEILRIDYIRDKVDTIDDVQQLRGMIRILLNEIQEMTDTITEAK